MNIEEVNEELKKYFSKSLIRLLAQFEATYDKLLLTVGEGRTPTPADLYNLDKYWELQNQLRIELQKLGDKQITFLSKTLRYSVVALLLVLFHATGGEDGVFCLVDFLHFLCGGIFHLFA